MKEYKLIKTEDLQFSKVREIRPQIVEEIKDNIEKNGFYEARVLSVIPKNGKYIVADGNHRLQAVLDINMKEVPCIVYEGEDVYKIAIEGNITENTYAPMDLFDWLGIISQLKEEGLTQEKIGTRIGMSEDMIKKYNKILSSIVTPVLDFAKQFQNGRVTKEVTNVTFNFTEGWFRSSGLYDLKIYQILLISRFMEDKFKWSKQKLQSEAKKYKQWQEFTEICKEELYDQDKLEILIELIENNTFKTTVQLKQKIEDFNKESNNKLINGDCIQELEQLEDSTIDIIITDPPYGVNYKSNRSQFIDSIAKTGVKNDDSKAFELLDDICKILVSKTKSQAHLYFCCSWKVECIFREIIGKYFEIKNIIIWDKLNHGAGDLEGNWSDRYEMIIFATKGNRSMSKRKANIIPISKISSSKLRHPTEKPVELIKQLLEASAQPNDTVCDPFMGGGSTIKACKEFGNLNYIGIELDKDIFEVAKAFIGGD